MADIDKGDRVRHPEKEWKQDNPSGRKPPWIRVRVPSRSNGRELTNSILRGERLTTVCEEAACPNINECWAKKHATFLIMGDICTRACAFCNIATGKPGALDPFEPFKVAKAVKGLGLLHTVITSVDRDDLADGGARHFSETIRQVRRLNPETTVEILTPDFRSNEGSLREAIGVILENAPDVFNHNIEVVPRFYPKIRPGSRYFGSLQLLSEVKRAMPEIFTKSGFMVGFGETRDEVHQILDDLRVAGVDFVTVGQYLQPTLKHARVERYVTPEEFEQIGVIARSKGFLMVAASPLTRSSYHAGDDFKRLVEIRRASTG